MIHIGDCGGDEGGGSGHGGGSHGGGSHGGGSHGGGCHGGGHGEISGGVEDWCGGIYHHTKTIKPSLPSSKGVQKNLSAIGAFP